MFPDLVRTGAIHILVLPLPVPAAGPVPNQLYPVTNNHITPCLWFDGTAEQAANLYVSLFRNSAIGKISRYGKEGFEHHGQQEGTAMAVPFTINGTPFTALNGGPIFRINPSISIFVVCPNAGETTALWNKLIEGGQAMMPLGTYDWSSCYGWLKDRFGMTWQLMAAAGGNQALSIRPSFLFTGPAFGKAGEAIRFYASVFPDSAISVMMPYPEGDPHAGKVLYSEFTLADNGFIAMDGPGEHGYTFNEAVSLQVFCDTQKEIDYYWEKLTDGGEESICGWLKDRFGVSW